MIIESRTDGHFDPCIGGGSSRDCERGECNARAMCAAANPVRSTRRHYAEHPPLNRPHPTCIDVTAIDQTPRSEWACGPECPKEA